MNFRTLVEAQVYAPVFMFHSVLEGVGLMLDAPHAAKPAARRRPAGFDIDLIPAPSVAAETVRVAEFA